MVDRLFVSFFGWMDGNWMIGWVVGWLDGWLIGWMHGCMHVGYLSANVMATIVYGTTQSQYAHFSMGWHMYSVE